MVSSKQKKVRVKQALYQAIDTKHETLLQNISKQGAVDNNHSYAEPEIRI